MKKDRIYMFVLQKDTNDEKDFFGEFTKTK